MRLPANWRTTLSAFGAAIFGLLTVVAALPYDLGAVANIFPPEWKANIAIAGAICTTILKVINGICQKDKSVTGGTVQQTVSGMVADPGTQTLVDQTVKASIASDDMGVTQAQRKAAQS